MKSYLMLSVLLTNVLLSTAGIAGDEPGSGGPGKGKFAQRQQGQGRPPIMDAMAHRMPLMLALDADQDGSISATELTDASKALAKLDKDGDGTLSPEELRPDFSDMAGEGRPRDGKPGSGGPPSGEMMAQMFEKRDADKDGKLSGDEIPERMRQNLTRVDENSDGAIDKSELQKAMAKMGDRAGKLRGAKKNGQDGAGVKPKRPPTE